ncbi:MAG: DUF4159 domain-containing protein [Chloroflexota bacterium]
MENKTELIKLLQEFPRRKLAPIDGMAVTGEVWREAHTYHDQYLRFHTLLGHGPGVLLGMQVTASNPADTSVNISPGVAIDSWGRLIVLPQAIRYEIGETLEGLNYLWLRYRESRPRHDSNITDDESRLYRFPQILPGAGATISEFPHVELGRIRRSTRIAKIVDAADPTNPTVDALDFRFRRDIGAPNTRILYAAAGQIGDVSDQTKHQMWGLQALGHGLKQMALAHPLHLMVDHVDWLTADLAPYNLLYLVGSGNAPLKLQEQEVARQFLEAGGTILIETSQRNQLNPASGSNQLTKNLARSLGRPLDDKAQQSPLLQSPFRFATPPPGYEKTGQILLGDRLIVSTYDYGSLWLGHQRNGTPNRETIRSAMEWGANLMTYIWEQQSK